MYFTKALVATVSFGAIATAAPAIGVTQDIVASVFMCTQINSQGACQTQQIPLGECIAFSNDFGGNIKSIQNQSGGVTCTWFLSTDCSGSSYDNQDDQNLTDGNGNFAAMQAASCS